MTFDQSEVRACSKCGLEKPVGEFYACRPTRCKECDNEASRVYRAANREQLRLKQAAYHAANPEKERERDRKRKRVNRKRDKEKDRKQFQDWSARNRERRAEYKKSYCQANPEIGHRYCAERRARKRACEIRDTAAIYALCSSDRKIRCYWCKSKTERGGRQVDHIIPLSREGKHASENLCIACTRCNQSKGNRLPEEFAGQIEMFGSAA